jgi:hypothetical protein
MPDALGSTLWRLLNWGFFLAGLQMWRKTFLPADLSPNQVAILFLLLLPLSIGSLNNAQANPLILGLMLIGVSGAANQRWSLAGACLAASILIKLYPVALALLVLLLYPRRFTFPFLLWLAIGLGLPYLLQTPEYVTRQYFNWYQVLKVDDRSQFELRGAYRDAWLLIRLIGEPISHATYHLIQIAAAAGIAGLCWWYRRTSSRPFCERDTPPDRTGLHWALELACAWMTVLGPATESCTYILLAPTLGWRLFEVWSRSASVLLRFLVSSSFGLFLITMMANWFPWGTLFHGLGLQPQAGLLLLSALLFVPPTLLKETPVAAPIYQEQGRKSA